MSSPQKKDRGGGGVIFGTLSFVIICAALVFGMSVFFRVSELAVTGAGRYSEQEIIEASGIEQGDNLMLINREAVERRIQSKLLYIGEVQVKRQLPTTIAIAVEESGGIAILETDGGLWLVDKSARLLEPCPQGERNKYMRIIGLSAVKPEAGVGISTPEEEKPNAALLQALLEAVAAAGLQADIATLDVQNPVNAEMDYLDGRFRVKLGSRDNLDYKLELLLEVVEKLEPGDRGIIDLSQDKRAQFSPFVE